MDNTDVKNESSWFQGAFGDVEEIHWANKFILGITVNLLKYTTTLRSGKTPGVKTEDGPHGRPLIASDHLKGHTQLMDMYN